MLGYCPAPRACMLTSSETKTMADPRRYYIDPMLVVDAGQNPVQASIQIQESPSGDWIKWHDFEDYKAAQRRNSSAEMNAKLGVEIAEMRSRIAALAAENERLRKAGDAMENELFRVILMELPGLEKEDINNQYIADWRAAKGVQS